MNENAKDLKMNENAKDLKNNTEFECGDEPEPGCFSSQEEFRYRVWEFFARCKYIMCW